MSVSCDRLVVFSGYSSTPGPPRYNWNIVESGVKYHNPKPYTKMVTEVPYLLILLYCTMNAFFSFFRKRTYQADLYTQNKYISVVTSVPSSQNILHAANRDKLHTVIEMYKTFLISLNLKLINKDFVPIKKLMSSI